MISLNEPKHNRHGTNVVKALLRELLRCIAYSTCTSTQHQYLYCTLNLKCKSMTQHSCCTQCTLMRRNCDDPTHSQAVIAKADAPVTPFAVLGSSTHTACHSLLLLCCFVSLHPTHLLKVTVLQGSCTQEPASGSFVLMLMAAYASTSLLDWRSKRNHKPTW